MSNLLPNHPHIQRRDWACAIEFSKYGRGLSRMLSTPLPEINERDPVVFLQPHFLNNGLKMPAFVSRILSCTLMIYGLYPTGQHKLPGCQEQQRSSGWCQSRRCIFLAWDYFGERQKFGDKLSRPWLLRPHFPYHHFPCGPPHMTPCKFIFMSQEIPKTLSFLTTFSWRQCNLI